MGSKGHSLSFKLQEVSEKMKGEKNAKKII
jgi:hypothetical protein